jgi:hypothetical protein
MTPLQKKRIRRIEKAISTVSRRGLIYSYGGGRAGSHMSTPPSSGSWTDCSGFAMWLCQVGDIRLKNYVGSTWSLAEEGEKGESPYFTLFIKNNANHDEHVIIRLRRRGRLQRAILGEFRWAECGGSDNPKSGGGPTWFRPTESRIKQFYIHRKFPELS